MKGENPGQQGGNSGENKKVTVSGSMSVQFDTRAINNVADAIKKETTRQQQTENQSNVISEGQRKQQKIANAINLFVFLATLGFNPVNVYLVDLYAHFDSNFSISLIRFMVLPLFLFR
jgi:1,4-dihydroxy-2-naphthoate octaprenyltransferase